MTCQVHRYLFWWMDTPCINSTSCSPSALLFQNDVFNSADREQLVLFTTDIEVERPNYKVFQNEWCNFKCLFTKKPKSQECEPNISWKLITWYFLSPIAIAVSHCLSWWEPKVWNWHLLKILVIDVLDVCPSVVQRGIHPDYKVLSHFRVSFIWHCLEVVWHLLQIIQCDRAVGVDRTLGSPPEPGVQRVQVWVVGCPVMSGTQGNEAVSEELQQKSDGVTRCMRGCTIPHKPGHAELVWGDLWGSHYGTSGARPGNAHRTVSILAWLLVTDAGLPLLHLLWLCTVPLCSWCFTICWMAQFLGPSRVLRSYSQQNLRQVSTYDLVSEHRATTFVFCFTVNGIVELRS